MSPRSSALRIAPRVGVGPNAWWRLAGADRQRDPRPGLPEELHSPEGQRLERAVLVLEAHAAILAGDVLGLEVALDALPDLDEVPGG